MKKTTNSMYEMLSSDSWKDFAKKYKLEITESWTGRDGYGMNAVLVHKPSNKNIAIVTDSGDGSEVKVDFADDKSEESMSFNDEVKCLTPTTNGPPVVSAEYAIVMLADIAECAIEIKKTKKEGTTMKKLIQSISPAGLQNEATSQGGEIISDTVACHETHKTEQIGPSNVPPMDRYYQEVVHNVWTCMIKIKKK